MSTMSASPTLAGQSASGVDLSAPATEQVASYKRRVFQFLLLFRWVSLLLPLAYWLGPQWFPSQPQPTYLPLFLLFIGMNSLITLFADFMNRALLRMPWLLVGELALSAVAIATTGGEAGPYYLYSLAPVLAGAFFFGIRGALLTGGVYTFFYAAALSLAHQALATTPDLQLVAVQLLGAYLMALVFGYASMLLTQLEDRTVHLTETSRDLQRSNQELQRINHQLQLIQNLTLTLQSSTDPSELQEQLLDGLVDDMGFRRAVVAIYDPGEGALTGWLSRGGSGTRAVNHATSLKVATDGGVVAQTMRDRSTRLLAQDQPLTDDPALDEALALGRPCLIFPMQLRGQQVGVLLTELSQDQQFDAPGETALDLLAGHAGVALGSLRLCINRAQRLAVEEERSRIAADMHDTVSQSLFGLTYGLNACAEMLPEEPSNVAEVKQHLGELQPLALDALQEIRSVILQILPGEVSRERFVNSLHKQLSALRLSHGIQLTVEVTDRFDEWPVEYRRQLLLIAQEGVANIARHAEARHAWVQLHDSHDRVLLAISDDGMGFDQETAPSLPGVGLGSIRNRIEGLGGFLVTQSDLGKGTRLQLSLPLPG
jgi:signal transduction histidine kinase